MNRPFIVAEINKRPERFDVTFVALTVLLCGLGIVTLYSGTLAYGERFFGDPLYFIKRQGLNLGVSIVALFFFTSINLEIIRKHLPKLVVFSLVLLVLPFLPGIGITKNGASRWIWFGFTTFQPSELAKMVIVLYLANIFAKKFDRFNEPEVSIYPPALMSFLFVGIVYLQNDFSTALFIIIIVLSLFFMAGVSMLWFVKFCAVVFPLVILMVVSREYRLERILSFLQPERDPLGAGYQVSAALEALSEGGFWGRGIGNGIRKISSIPEVQSDFIFAVWAEEMGFFGVVLFFLLLALFAWRGFRIGFRCKDRFRFLLAFGCTFVIFFQALMNVGVVVRSFPATGIPLPFFSAGGSSLLITLCLCGLIINVSRWKPEGELQNV